MQTASRQSWPGPFRKSAILDPPAGRGARGASGPVRAEGAPRSGEGVEKLNRCRGPVRWCRIRADADRRQAPGRWDRAGRSGSVDSAAGAGPQRRADATRQRKRSGTDPGCPPSLHRDRPMVGPRRRRRKAQDPPSRLGIRLSALQRQCLARLTAGWWRGGGVEWPDKGRNGNPRARAGRDAGGGATPAWP
jgi:hypothetical protein